MNITPRKALAIAASALVITAGAALADSPETDPAWDNGQSTFTLFEGANDVGIYNSNYVNMEDRIHTYVQETLGLPEVAQTIPLTEDGATVTIYWDPDDQTVTYTNEAGQTAISTDDYIGEERGNALAAVVLDDGHGFSYIVGAGYAPVADRAEGIDTYQFSVLPNFMTAPHHTWETASINFDAQEASGITRTGILEIGGPGELQISRFTTPTMEFMAVSDPLYIKRIGVIDQAPTEMVVGSIDQERDGAIHLASADLAELELIATRN